MFGFASAWAWMTPIGFLKCGRAVGTEGPWHGGQLITWIAKDRLSEEVKTVHILD